MAIVPNESQTNRLIDYLKKHNEGITITEALNRLGIYSLSSRISEIKRRGIKVDSSFVDITNRFGEKVRIKRYYLSGNHKDGK